MRDLPLDKTLNQPSYPHRLLQLVLPYTRRGPLVISWVIGLGFRVAVIYCVTGGDRYAYKFHKL